MFVALGMMIFAIFTPKLYSGVWDQKLEHKVGYEDMELTAYQVPYDSFYQKLYVIAVCKYKGYSLKTVKVKEIGESLSDEELTKLIQDELGGFREQRVFSNKVNISTEQLLAREKYTLYDAKGSGGFNAVQFLKVVYQLESGTITVYLDSEFHKIYDMEIQTQGSIYHYLGMFQVEEDNKVLTEQNEQYIIAQKAQENAYVGLDYMVGYLGLEQLNWYVVDEMMEKKEYDSTKWGRANTMLRYVVEYEEGVSLPLYMKTWENEEGQFWHLGINIEN